MAQGLAELHEKVDEIRSELDQFRGTFKAVLWVLGILQPVLVGASIWIASSVIELRERQAVIEDRMRIERSSAGNVASANQ